MQPNPYFSFKRGGKWENLKEQNKQTIKEETPPPPPFLDTIYVHGHGNRVLHQNEYMSTINEKQPPTFSITRVQSGFGRNVGK